MTAPRAVDGSPPRSAPERILEAAARRIAAAGAAELSLQDVAEAAGVSKALIHYHFTDKAALLARVASWLASEVVAREGAALDGVDPTRALDALWAWLEGELARGDVRVLIDLTQVPAESVRAAAQEAAAGRRMAAERTVESLFAALALTPRVPTAMIADVLVAFVDGLALAAARSPERNHRVAFDVFWLAMLSLAE
jgi:AcrR family transcriptional regulator